MRVTNAEEGTQMKGGMTKWRILNEGGGGGLVGGTWSRPNVSRSNRAAASVLHLCTDMVSVQCRQGAAGMGSAAELIVLGSPSLELRSFDPDIRHPSSSDFRTIGSVNGSYSNVASWGPHVHRDVILPPTELRSNKHLCAH